MIRVNRSILLALILSAPISSNGASATQIAGLQQLYDGRVLPDVAVATLSHTERLLPVRTVHRRGSVRALPRSAKPFPKMHFQDHGHEFDLYDYLAVNRVAGLLILKNGEIAFEDYELGIGPQTHWASFSMAKSVTSTLVGAAVLDGSITSLDDSLSRYVPVLRGSAYEGVTIRQLLTMSSGVRWNETYTDPNSDRRKVLALQLTGNGGDVLSYMRSLSRAGAPGSVWNYSTGETYILGAVIEGATHRLLADYLSEKIWSKAGMEQDATWWVEGRSEKGWAGSGIGATLRDYGRFGLIAVDQGRLNGRLIVPPGWFDEAGAAHRIAGKTVDYGYMWWIPPQSNPIHAGAFEAQGIFGQYMYINPREKLVIVVLSAQSKPESPIELDDDAFFAAVATALH
jgi:CubicO group peptidase (beta-lactamase class C family)